jgi:LysR family transcriptional activator of nhaA
MLNYRHLYYFWVVAKEGGFTRAAEQLGMAVQTISAQVRELERSLGAQLLRPAGRGVELTDAGRVAYARADDIFQLGQALPNEVTRAATRQVMRFSVGFSDGLSKLAAHALLDPVLATPDLHLVCHEGEFDQLLGELTLHHLDLVLSCQGALPNPNLRVISDRVAVAPVDWYGPDTWVGSAQRKVFPQVLSDLPLLLPTGHGMLRGQLDRWFADHGIVPNIVGEFEDSALMLVFAARGMGVFPVSRLGRVDVGLMPGLRLLGRCTDLHEEIYAIRTRRSQQHPLVKRVLQVS